MAQITWNFDWRFFTLVADQTRSLISVRLGSTQLNYCSLLSTVLDPKSLTRWPWLSFASSVNQLSLYWQWSQSVNKTSALSISPLLLRRGPQSSWGRQSRPNVVHCAVPHVTNTQPGLPSFFRPALVRASSCGFDKLNLLTHTVTVRLRHARCSYANDPLIQMDKSILFQDFDSRLSDTWKSLSDSFQGHFWITTKIWNR